MYVSYPIELYVTKTKEVEVDQSETIDEADEVQVEEVDETKTDDVQVDETKTDDVQVDETKTDDVEVEDAEDSEDEDDDDEDPNQETKTETVEYQEFEQVNDQKPIWTKDSKEVTPEEYEAFYKGLTNDHESYSAVKHFKVEGGLEFTGLLYTSKKAPFDMFQGQKKETDVKLYVRRVFLESS